MKIRKVFTLRPLYQGNQKFVLCWVHTVTPICLEVDSDLMLCTVIKQQYCSMDRYVPALLSVENKHGVNGVNYF